MQIELSEILELYNAKNWAREEIIKLQEIIAKQEDRISKLEALIQNCSSYIDGQNRPAYPIVLNESKYKGLSEYLYEKWDKRIKLTYEEIEDLLGFALPATAHNVPHSYWANTEYHPYAKSWLLLGYKAKVNVKTKSVMFERNLY